MADAAYFTGLIREYGATSEGVGFSERSHLVRLQAIRGALGEVRGQSVLDLGCGYGALLRYLVKQVQYPSRYMGVDCTPSMLEAAREYHSPVVTEWLEGDLFQRVTALGRFDVVVANGVLNREVPDVRALTERLIALAWKHVGRVAVLTFVTTLAPNRKPGVHYHKPGDLLKAALECGCGCFTLDHSYLPHDVMLVMRRRGGWEN